MTIFDTTTNNQAALNQASSQSDTASFQSNPTLREHVAISMQQYLKQMQGQPLNDVYDLVLSQVEEPLLRAIMEHTRNNQTKAAKVLGLNRGTLRKKLKRYNLL
ncbi:DNA-binding transcriptional regulator Fis [Kangiella marina]|uniref:Putative Fis-like DNA-binding protein n=1 Tax=Kangiella marina TaxID=1079178 RepID=A0ABP8IKX2_9GAMM